MGIHAHVARIGGGDGTRQPQGILAHFRNRNVSEIDIKNAEILNKDKEIISPFISK
jgi:hypothetical protein